MQPDTQKNYDVDSRARLYDTEINAVLDRLVPPAVVVRGSIRGSKL